MMKYVVIILSALFVIISCTPKDRTARINEIYEELEKEVADETKDESKTPDENLEPDDEQVEEDVEIIDESDEDAVDPVVVLNKAWTKQWGTSEGDDGYSVAVDSSGNIFITGYTVGDLDENNNIGGSDIFMTKWDSDGTKAWTKQWGTNENDIGFATAVDSSGNIFVTGITEGSLDGHTNAGKKDIFLTKWNSDGTKAWTKQWGTNEDDYGYSVAVDSSDNIFVTGFTEGSLDSNTSVGGNDIFLTKWNSDGTKAWTKQRGTSEDNFGSSVAVDSSGNILVAGWTFGNLDENTNNDGSDIFLTKWNSDGTFLWTKQWGTNDNDYGYSVAVDNSDNILVAGTTYSDLDGNINKGEIDVFLTKWNNDETKAWSKQLGTSVSDIGYCVAVDSSGSIFVTGYTQGSFYGNKIDIEFDIFMAVWNSDGTEAWVKQWGTNKDDYGPSVAVDNSGNIFVIGDTEGSLDGNTNIGGSDIFLTKWERTVVE